METASFTSTDIRKLFRMDERVQSKQTLFNAEERNEIPKAFRSLRGKVPTRYWSLDQLPAIGARFGFLPKPKKQHVITVYTSKGGCLKSTTAYNLARILALNGIKVLLIGLDWQLSVTEIGLPQPTEISLEEALTDRAGLYHYFYDGFKAEEIIKKTNLPTLDILPETTELVALTKRLASEARREYYLKDKLLKELTQYEVVVFDNGPNWSLLVENSLVAATTVLSPIGCDIGSYQALKNHSKVIEDFRSNLKLNWDNQLMIPTLLEKSKLSQQIYAAYLSQYTDQALPLSIRRAVAAQEATVLNRSIIEYDPSAPLAQDYYDLINRLWKKLEG